MAVADSRLLSMKVLRICGIHNASELLVADAPA
jgi:hypothetical protein